MTGPSLQNRAARTPFARSVLLMLLLVAGTLPPPLRAQEAHAPAGAEPTRAFSLEPNVPNPADPDTWIPFYLDDSLFKSRESVPVTIRIFNILRQVVAIPEWIDSSGRHQRVINLSYRDAGRKLAYWDGKDTAGRRVPSGVYYCELVVGDHEGPPLTRKVIVVNRRKRGLIPWFGNH